MSFLRFLTGRETTTYTPSADVADAIRWASQDEIDAHDVANFHHTCAQYDRNDEAEMNCPVGDCFRDYVCSYCKSNKR